MAGTAVTIHDQSSKAYPIAGEVPPYTSTRKPETQYGAAVDLGDATALRLDITTHIDTLGQSWACYLDLAIEQAPTSSGPWSDLMPQRRLTDGTTRVVLGPCDRYARARFVVHHGGATFTVAGESFPAA